MPPKRTPDPSDFMIQIYDSLINRDKNRFNSNNGEKYETSKTSADKYIQFLRIVNDGINFDNLDFLKDIEAVITKIQKYKLTTQRNIITSVISVLQMYSNDKRYTKLLDKYRDELSRILEEIKTTTNGNDRTDTQKKNWVSMDDIQKKFNELYDKFLIIKEKDKIYFNDYNILLSLLVLSLYTLIPPRRSQDYVEMYLTNGAENIEKDKNYFDIDSMKFIFNAYKTKKTYGEQIEQLDEETDGKLLDIIEVYLKHHPILKTGDFKDIENVRFLMSKNGGRLYANYINTMLKKIFNGKNVGPSMLRAVYTSYILGPEIEKLEEAAEDMGTSVDKLRSVYNKTDL